MITIMIKIMSKHTADTKYTLTGDRRYLKFSARVNEAADDFLKIQMTNFLNFRHFSHFSSLPRYKRDK